MSAFGGEADVRGTVPKSPLLAEAVEKVGERSSRIALPQQSNLGGATVESLLLRSDCWRIIVARSDPPECFFNSLSQAEILSEGINRTIGRVGYDHFRIAQPDVWKFVVASISHPRLSK